MNYLNKFLNLRHDSLFRNSFYLMLATAVMAGFGFFFWLINAKLFSAQDIGIATTLISVMGLIGSFGLVGFGSTIVRYLPKSKNPNDSINTGIIIVGIATFLLSILFVIFAEIISPKLSFINDNIIIIISFIFFCIMTSLNVLTDSIFLANRQAKYTLIINTTFSAIKMILPFAFISWGALGIFMAAAIAQVIGFILSISIMIWKFNYRPYFIIKMSMLKEVWRFSTSNYIVGILTMIPVSLLPIIITNHLGAETSAYFYIVMMIGNLLYVIPRATTNSLFAEGSNDEESLDINTKKSIKIIFSLLIPAIIFLFFFGKFILQIFGNSYATEGFTFLIFISISAIAVSASNLYGTLFYIKKNLRLVIIINATYAGSIITLSYFLLPLGLTGIGCAWLGGNIITGIISALSFHKSKNCKNSEKR